MLRRSPTPERTHALARTHSHACTHTHAHSRARGTATVSFDSGSSGLHRHEGDDRAIRIRAQVGRFTAATPRQLRRTLGNELRGEPHGARAALHKGTEACSASSMRPSCTCHRHWTRLIRCAPSLPPLRNSCASPTHTHASDPTAFRPSGRQRAHPSQLDTLGPRCRSRPCTPTHPLTHSRTRACARSRSRSGAVRFVGGAQVRLLEKSGLVRDLDVRELAAEELLALAFKVRLPSSSPLGVCGLVHAQPCLCSAMHSSSVAVVVSTHLVSACRANGQRMQVRRVRRY